MFELEIIDYIEERFYEIVVIKNVILLLNCSVMLLLGVVSLIRINFINILIFVVKLLLW